MYLLKISFLLGGLDIYCSMISKMMEFCGKPSFKIIINFVWLLLCFNCYLYLSVG